MLFVILTGLQAGKDLCTGPLKCIGRSLRSEAVTFFLVFQDDLAFHESPHFQRSVILSEVVAREAHGNAVEGPRGSETWRRPYREFSLGSFVKTPS